ncbi:MAG: hypothetical protein ACP59X_14190 [Solidesulfovibrio sp. DCME]|uniref:hypothetical protein n=1 Tax=Solidesulfovibrio sp. DCME TaxID=3447380 RepID=UPI003D12C24D
MDATKVQNGMFSNANGNFSIDRVVYGDGIAVVVVEYGIHGINHPLRDVYVFKLVGGAQLLKLLALKDMANDCGRWFDPETVLDVVVDNVSVAGSQVIVPIYTDGPRCCPENIAFLVYDTNVAPLRLVDKPHKERFIPVDKRDNKDSNASSLFSIASGQDQAPPPSLAGKWKWFTGDIHTFRADGSIDTSSRFLPNSSWSCEDAQARRYVIIWMGGKFVDHVTISPDGLSLSGKNQYGHHVTGRRL